MGCKRASGLDDEHTRLPLGRNPGFPARSARAGERCRGDRRWQSSGELFQRGGRADLGAGSRRSAPRSCEPSGAQGTGGACDGDASPGSGQRWCRYSGTRLRDQDRAQGRQPASCRAVAVAGRDRRPATHHRVRSGHHHGGRTAGKGGAAPCRRRPDQPRGGRHRSRAEGRLYQRRVSRLCSGTRWRKRWGGGRTS